MRLNRYVAQATGLSRRAADTAIEQGSILVNGELPQLGQTVGPNDIVTHHSQTLTTASTQTIILHKPAGYVCSRNGQGSKTVYDLLPPEMHRLKPVGRLDKDSSGLLLLTNDGTLHQTLTHPGQQKTKQYEIVLNKPLAASDQTTIGRGVELDDGPSRLALHGSDTAWQVTMHEGRNRQIRRTFAARGYTVERLHRTVFGQYTLPADLPSGSFRDIE